MQQYLANLRGGDGKVESSGHFTLDLRKAREKLRRYQLAEPCFYLLKLVQAVVSAGAARIELSLGRREVHFVAHIRPQSPLASSEQLIESLSDPQGLPPGPIRHLAIALNSAWALEPEKVRWGYWSCARNAGWVLTVAKEDLALEAAGGAPARDMEGFDMVEFTVSRDATIGSFVRNAAAEHAGIIHRCAFCPVPLYIDSRLLIGQWHPAPTPPEAWYGGPRYSLERYECAQPGVGLEPGFRIAAPPWAKLKTRQDVLINPEEVIYDGDNVPRLPTFSFQGIPHLLTHQPEVLHCKRALALPLPQLESQDLLILVKHGVTLEPITWARIGGAQAIVTADDVKTDLSEFTAVRDAELDALLQTIRPDVQEAWRKLLPLCRELTLHSSKVSDSEQVLVTCLSMFFFNIFGLLLAGLVSWYRGRAAAAQRAEDRERLRRFTEMRLRDLLHQIQAARTNDK